MRKCHFCKLEMDFTWQAIACGILLFHPHCFREWVKQEQRKAGEY